jgi:site-specific DNA-methyltransferase (adenine-specific)
MNAAPKLPPCWACGGRGRSGPRNLPCHCQEPKPDRYIALSFGCPQCAYMWPRSYGTQRCPSCGYDRERMTYPRHRSAHGKRQINRHRCRRASQTGAGAADMRLPEMSRVEQIGDATLYLGDMREILPTLDGYDVVMSDPPYGTGGWRRTQGGKGSDPAAKLIREEWDDGALEWLSQCRGMPVLSFWPAQHMPEMMAASKAAGYAKHRMLYMRKSDPKPQVGGRVMWSVEPIVVLSADGFQLYGGTDWIEASTPRLNRDTDATGHPYQKPLDVMLWLVEKVRAETIVDPFLGSGTTGVAAVKRGRSFIGIEQDVRYFDISCRRIEAAQKQGDLLRDLIPRQKPTQGGLAL